MAAAAVVAPLAGPTLAAGRLEARMIDRELMAPARSLGGLARSRGLHFGAAVRPEQLAAETDLRDCAVAQCTSLTPEIHLKWDALEPRPGDYVDAPVETLIAFAQSRGMRVRGHTLLWWRSTPEWAKREILQARRWDLPARHISRTLGRYADRIRSWDVVNEPIDTVDGEDGLRRDGFLQAYGPGYIVCALEQARAQAPDAQLFINDYGFEYGNAVDAARRDRLLRLVEELRLSGAPLDGVGIQAHLDLGKGPLAQREVEEFLKRLAGLGLAIEITELDVMEVDRSAPVDTRDQRVADETRRYLDIALANPSVRAITTWGLSDRHSWLSDNNRIDGTHRNRGLPYDETVLRKSMYDAIRSAIENLA